MQKKLKDLMPEDLDRLTICEDCYSNRLNCPFYAFAACQKNNFKELLKNKALIVYEMCKNYQIEVREDEI